MYKETLAGECLANLLQEYIWRLTALVNSQAVASWLAIY